MSTTILILAAAYFLGSVPFGFLIGKIYGVDIRTVGSKNIGATNVFRTLGKKPGIAAFLLDALKGWLAVWLSRKFEMPESMLVLTGLIAILGHNYTCWLGFKGGKGIATSAGVLIGLVPLAALTGFGVWIVLFYLTRYVSVASIGAALALPLVVFLLQRFSGESEPWLLGFSILVALLAVWRHRSNIQRLRAGTESRFVRTKNNKADGVKV